VRPSLWFVVPAFKRYKISQVCFKAQAWACAQLKEMGVDASVVVIADDRNLDLAQKQGFYTVDRDNRLGAKFNDGFQFAASEGVEYVCPLGSDSFTDPNFFRELPGKNELLCTRLYSAVRKDGLRRADFRIGYVAGVGRVFRTELLRGCHYRPLPEDRSRGCDTATWQAIRNYNPARVRYHDPHQFTVVGFQSNVQITSYATLCDRWLIAETDRPFDELTNIYPADLVADIRACYPKPKRVKRSVVKTKLVLEAT
jgi:hypothetical protein